MAKKFFSNNYCSFFRMRRLIKILAEQLRKNLPYDNSYIFLTCSGNSSKIAYDIFQKLELRLKECKILIIYDGTQTLGLIQSRLLSNPLMSAYSVVFIGGTHKTLPGPACGVIMTNDLDLVPNLDTVISPKLLRNVQPNNMVSFLLALIEQEEVGLEYQQKIIWTSNHLAKLLEQKQLCPARISNECFSQTHQIFLMPGKQKSENLYRNAETYNVTLNIKRKRLFGGTGIRLGTQQIARYNWGGEELNILADLIHMLSFDNPDPCKINTMIEFLFKRKKFYFALDDIFIS